MSAEEELLPRAYLAYNGQDVDGLLLNRIRPIFGEYYGDPERADDLAGAEKPPPPAQQVEGVAADAARPVVPSDEVDQEPPDRLHCAALLIEGQPGHRPNSLSHPSPSRQADRRHVT
ncbi:hypothetical protein [Streptomyces sp. NPDC017993]|uniref:hypothetical protein n=1 Tax=Streptomyces sp. NPDC017993 TaxID=3365027 RepID=UPI003789F871